MIYLKEFATQAAYESAESSLLTPNVALITENGGVKYVKGAPEPPTPTNPIVTCKFHINEPTDPEYPTPIIQSDAFLNEIEVMKLGGEVITKKKNFVFETAGDYIFELTLKENGKIANNAFFCCENYNYLTDITIGNGVTEIGNEAFKVATEFTGTTIEIPNTVTKIGYNAFDSLNGATSITLPSGLTEIEAYCFYWCNDLLSVDIPSGVTSIGYNAFEMCRSLTSITCNAPIPPELGEEVFENTNNCPIYVPAASVDTYKATPGWWEYYANRIQAIP